MENILPIVIALIFFAYKQYTKHTAESNKHATPIIPDQDIANGESVQKPSLDDYISKFMGLNDADLQYDAEEYQNKAYDYNKSEIENNNNLQSAEKQLYSIESDNENKVEEETETQFRTNMNKVEKDAEFADFDLRQAVLYDAVLNPPYINN
ncbi:MAG: hypothetical protein B6I18_03205 [Bacteroidetes bacterium 4572_112]|nr:MAG: hypothetical protein B6I18_03205 [Bacteroidetes bacterium 4572_112]